MDRTTLEKARALLENVTPMNRDCGRICGAACCQPDEEGHGGVFLFPGEEELIGEGVVRKFDDVLRVSPLHIE